MAIGRAKENKKTRVRSRVRRSADRGRNRDERKICAILKRDLTPSEVKSPVTRDDHRVCIKGGLVRGRENIRESHESLRKL